MKRKLFPLLVLIPLILAGCSLFDNLKSDQPLTDAEMATRVAELLSTMTTPTSQLAFPPTATLGEIVAPPTSTPVVLVVTSPTPTVEVGGLEETPSGTETVDVPVLEMTPTPSDPTATPEVLDLPDSDPLNSLGTASSVDNLDNNTKWSWPSGADNFTDVEFSDGFMLLTNISDDSAGWRLPGINQQVNSYIELTANSGTCSDKDSYGIIFRVPVFNEPDQGYLFQVRCDGYYRLWKWDGKEGEGGKATSLISWKWNTAINKGANKTNRLGVMVKDSRIKLYVNGVELGAVSDSSYEAGFFGVFVRSGGTTDYTVKLDKMQYWENP